MRWLALQRASRRNGLGMTGAEQMYLVVLSLNLR
jgi:hypothetical protein